MFEVIPGYTRRVKTAISIPDETFQRAERKAAELRMSRSQFITRAIRRYLTELEGDALTSRIDTALDIAWPRDVQVVYRQHGDERTPYGERAW